MRKTILILTVFILILFAFGCSSEQKEIQNKIENLKISIQESYEPVEEIEKARYDLFETFWVDPFFLQDYLDKSQKKVNNIREKISVLEPELEKIKNEINSLKEKELNQEQAPFFDKLSEAGEEYELYLKSLNELLDNIETYIRFQTHYVNFYSKKEEANKHINSASVYTDAVKYENATTELSKAKEIFIDTKEEINKADEFISFEFNKDWKTYTDLYTDYINTFDEAVNLSAHKKYKAADKKYDESTALLAQAKSSLPTDFEIRDEMQKWELNNIREISNNAENHFDKAQKLYQLTLS